MRDWKKMLHYALWPLLSLGLYFALHAEKGPVSHEGLKPFNFLTLRAIGDKDSPAMSRNATQDAADSLEVSDSLLIDSILTIVQNYYVDEPRVDNRNLMESTLRSLHENDIAVLTADSDRVWRLTKNSDALTFRFGSRYTYDELMRDGLRVSQFLEKHKSREKTKKPVPSGAFQFLSAMLASLDPHSNLLTPDEYRDLRQGTEGSFGGLGVVVGIQDDVLTVIKPLPKSPAARAGVNKFDRIMQIDGKSTFGTTLDDLVQYMRGEPGTKVNLFVLREGDFAPRRLSLTREIIQVDSVESKIVTTDKGKILYAYIDSFSSRTAVELRDAMIKAQHADPLAGVVLDMRSNPGGLLDQAVKVADLFIDEGRILSTQGRTREYEMAKHNLYRFDYPVVVLTNGDTASASEIVAGALRDHGRALVIGEPSFGKGSVQTVFELPGEQALKLTIARYFTPKGISIQNTGIMPDIWLQPVHRSKDNWNLLGDYRYKSERYLDHSLDQGKAKVASQAEEWKAFYLLPEATAPNPKVPAKDLPLEFAQRLLGELAQKDGLPMPKERLRSSYWKASVSQFLRENLEKIDSSTGQWLQQKSNVNWSETTQERTAFDPRRMKFAIDLAEKFQVQEGQPAMIPWRVKNTGRDAITRLSVFVSSNRNNLGTTEVLIGRVEPGQELKGVVRYDMKTTAKESPVHIRVGLARSGGPLTSLERSLTVDIKEGETPRFDITMKLTQETGGQVTGVLEAGEQGKLEVTLRNNSQVSASVVEAKVANLAGKQIKVDERKFKVGVVEPGDTRVLLIPIQASLDLSSEQLQLGVSVVSREQGEASKSHFFLSGTPAPRVSKTNVNTGRVPWTEN